MPEVPLGELAWLALAVIAAGIVTGLLAGLFGIGGGAVIVPVLFEVFRLLGVPEEVRMQLCVGTSLAIIVPTTVRSYRAHRARGLVVPAVIRSWALPAVIGVVAGSVTAAFAPAQVFELAFVVIAGVIAAKLLIGREAWVLGRSLPGPAAMTGCGFIVGLASSLMGISGGSLATMMMTLYGVPIHNAVATSAGLGVPITIAGTLGYLIAGLSHRALLPPLSVGFVSVIGVVMIAPISSWIAPFGARIAHRLPRRRLEVGFGLFLIAASLRFVASLLGA
ncbi:MAG TPA: sulfite exporter TauE/SafE family protein [Stellaceae bacterium]|nr:sulfite exporter TauE/SafE family protein [Stellaceae bacterium]